MTTKRFDELPAIAAVTADDLFPVMDGAATTSKVTAANVRTYMAPDAATTTASGIVELATSAETITGTDTARAVTPEGGAAAYVAKSLVDAKGDLLVASAADTPARLAVGTNGQVLMADSAEATGVKWAAAAGGSTLPASRNMSASGAYAVAGYSLPGVVYNLTASNFISTAGRIYYSPCIWNVDSVITDVAMVVTSGYAATVGRIGLYTCDEQWTPTDLVIDFGTIDHTTGGTKTITGLSQSVSGMTRYALAYMADAQFRCSVGYGGCVHGGPGQGPLASWDDWSGVRAYGAMPATAPAPDRWPGYRLFTIGAMKWTTA